MSEQRTYGFRIDTDLAQLRAKGTNVSNWPPLLDAAGNSVPVDMCCCGRPKEARKPSCCDRCGEWRNFANVLHSSACNIRCATLGVSGFGVRMCLSPPRAQYLTPSEFEKSLDNHTRSHGRR